MASFILDTEDLSTIRGGGLLLLDAVYKVQDRFFQPDSGGDVLSTGASVGLFRFQGDEAAADQLVRKIRKFLRAEYRHATLLVERVTATPGAFLRDRERLIARIRRAQLATPSLAVPTFPPDKTPRLGNQDNAVCALDHLRPAAGDERKMKGQSLPLSPSTRCRRKHGVKQKTDFYAEVLKRDLPGETALLADLEATHFALHFNHIAASQSWGPLNNKMAVLYLDGNRFSKSQNTVVRKACAKFEGAKADEEAIAALRRFDATVKANRARFLHAVLEQALETGPNDDAWWFNTEHENRDDDDWDEKVSKRLRLETLLWGGDEIILVLPAWKGWEVARLFLNESKCWSIDDQPLDHALGLVFCHEKAPIHRVVSLARSLADHAKKAVGRDLSSLAYQVLESFDHIGADVAARFADLCEGLDAHPRRLILTREGVEALDQHMKPLRSEGGLPQRQMKRLVRALFTNHSIDNAKAANEEMALDKTFSEKTLKPLLAGLASGYRDIDESRERRGNKSWLAWYHIEQLWDYVSPSQPGLEDRS
ncbi:hypothetical protein F11_00930 [Rhodospirillum rubrum F11]|uniref:hypothetical protein n=1 Tax=Rhodospirillum rubrum TaxID=1085 RepID=UPI000229D5B5|nr:hypothetical protein [Rhodospirillum rubrum]AEO46656.1 hypothetical protein F11_00930 [Rhodospirillum rubrum F11]